MGEEAAVERVVGEIVAVDVAIRTTDEVPADATHKMTRSRTRNSKKPKRRRQQQRAKPMPNKPMLLHRTQKSQHQRTSLPS